MLTHRLRRWPNINPTLAERLFAVASSTEDDLSKKKPSSFRLRSQISVDFYEILQTLFSGHRANNTINSDIKYWRS